MGERFLTTSDWSKFSKGKDYKDAALLKALAAFEKAERSGPGEALKALEELEKQSDQLRKAYRADKQLAAYVGDLEKALARQRKASEEEAAKKAPPQRADTIDEDQSPALLTTKMVPLLRQIRSGDTAFAKIAMAGKQTVVLLSRKAIGPAQRKLLTDELGTTSGVKFVDGTCVFEANAYTFVVQSAAGGLAVRVKAALFKQTEQRVKVRVRGEDPNDVDDDGDPAEPDARPGTAGAAPADAAQAERPASPSPERSAELMALASRLASLEPEVLAALRDQRTDASKLRALADFARGKTAAGAVAAATQALDNLEKLLRGSAPPSGGGEVPPAPPLPEQRAKPAAAASDAFKARLTALLPRIKAAQAAGGPAAEEIKLRFSEAGVFARKNDFAQANALIDRVEAMLPPAGRAAAPGKGPSLVALQQARLQWDTARKTVHAELDKLRSAILAVAGDEPEFAQIVDALGAFDDLKESFDEALIDTLDEALNAPTPEARADSNREAARLIANYRRVAESHPLLDGIDDNPFVSVAIVKTLSQTLDTLSARLAA